MILVLIKNGPQHYRRGVASRKIRLQTLSGISTVLQSPLGFSYHLKQTAWLFSHSAKTELKQKNQLGTQDFSLAFYVKTKS